MKINTTSISNAFVPSASHFFFFASVRELNPRTYTQIHTPTVVQMGGGATGGLWRHQQWSSSWPPSCILPRIRNQVKTARNVEFLCLAWEITHKWALCLILATRFTFLLKKVGKKHDFHSKMAWTPPTYDVISRNHRNWPLLNLTQNAREGWMNSYWQNQVPMFYPLGENSDKP